jgi:hypothetical protein
VAVAIVLTPTTPLGARYHDSLDASVAVIATFLLITVLAAMYALRLESRMRDRAAPRDDAHATDDD